MVVSLLFFPETKRFSRTYWHVTAILFISTMSHAVLDAFTNAGLGIGFLIPFDDTRYFAPWRPLTASPLSISRFLNGSGLPILLNEAKWIGIPLVATLTSIVLARRYFRRADD
jgi:inner membrane protein